MGLATCLAGLAVEPLVRLDVPILDELGYLPFSASGRAPFHLLSKLYERTSVIITTISASANGRLSSATPR